ncbi:carcinoembryonic antigen-related cell adhesion molecule 2 isoform a precursor [Mus musculus]|uniref:Cell adhesion molecule CEACAM2 n=1 Tax=Mus musculus TaxID=10090 RepID=CEAM2_MOUSE|nr:carcinoembryonic antigen-related cell adhesion molecule 2 isoform a precursor [Mus musculus]Q925P2.3 RecName: Full=Carcinoembryonic antigen-related cell adhesion molecule 2; Short=CEA-related cell adhesion molecule 2; AltName: Full=Biliary glycoprotein 2; Short=BGP-2; Flags: Precursor [Mus musculus]|eukprot:NP_001106839.1 carcinoembryonic antigen-related cell adhesion molecule 2 isoform a precursor [Mus musculus]
MELASAHLHKGQVPWFGLLLTASLLASWSPPTTAQVTVMAFPLHAAEGNNVILVVYNMMKGVSAFSWHKGSTTSTNAEIVRFVTGTNKTIKGPVHSGRETLYSNGSLLIQRVTMKDTGVYTIEMTDQNYRRRVLTGQFHVHTLLLKSNITSNNSNPVEGDDSVSLTCDSYTDPDNITYLWSRNGESLSEGDRLKLSEGNRTLTLLNVTRNDTGPYVCETRNPVSVNRSDPFSLNIIYGPDTPIISPSDIYLHPGSNLNLSCHAASNPPAQYFWLINEKPHASSQELFIPNITTNNSGTYTCFVNNSVTGLSRTTVKNITVLEPVTQPSLQVTNTTVKELDSVTLTCLSKDRQAHIHWIFNNDTLLITEKMTTSQAGLILKIDPIKREDAGEYQCEISNPVSVKRSNSIKLEVIFDSTYDISDVPIAVIITGAVAGVILIAGLAYRLCSRKSRWGSDQRDLTEHKPSASNHNLAPSDNSPNKVDDVAYTVLNFNSQQPNRPTSAPSSPRATETVYSEVKKK